MSWASRRRATYLSGIFLFFAVVVGGPLAYHFLTIPPTCHDGIQNQGETAIDEGGPCLMLDPSTLQPEAVLWSRSFKVRDGTYTGVAVIDNPNQDAGVPSVSYTFSLYDSNNILIAERAGSTYIMPGALTPVLEPRIDTGNRIVAHTSFEFTSSLPWERMSNAAQALTVSQNELSDTVTSPRLSAEANNVSVSDVISPIFVAIIYDASGNAFAASETQVDRIDAGSSTPITFTWPDAFSSQPAQLQILPLLPPVPSPAGQR